MRIENVYWTYSELFYSLPTILSFSFNQVIFVFNDSNNNIKIKIRFQNVNAIYYSDVENCRSY